MCSLRVLICNVAACCFSERISTPSRTATTRLLVGIAMIGAFVVRRTWRRADILSLMAETAGALSDAETAGFAKIILPGIAGVSADRLLGRSGLSLDLAACKGLRMGEGRRLLQWKSDLRIGGEIGVAARVARAAARDDVPARTIGEIGESVRPAVRQFQAEYPCAAARAGRRRCAAPSGNARRRDRPRGRPAALRERTLSRHWIDTT